MRAFLTSLWTGIPPWLALFGGLGAIWGSSFLFTHEASLGLGVLPTAGLRVGIASLTLLPLLLAQGLGARMMREWRVLLLLGALNSGLPSALYAYAVQHISTGLSSILNATTPLFGAIVSWLWLGEKLRRRQVLGLALGLAGVVLLAWDTAGLDTHEPVSASAWAVLACLGATTCYALSASLAQKHLPGVPPLLTATGSQLGGLALLAGPAWVMRPEVWPGMQAWAAVIVLGVLCSGVAYLLYFQLIAQCGPARALAVTYLMPVFAMAYGYGLLGEPVTPWMLLCACLIGLGTALSAGLLPKRTD
jgi:drug/metabolite transporter (DMT)-like permease